MISSKRCKSVDYVLLVTWGGGAMISFGFALFRHGDSSHHLLATTVFTGLAVVYARVLMIERRLNLAEDRSALVSHSES